MIKEIAGRKKVEKHGRKGPGNVRKKVKNSKRKYIIITRKLRKYLKEMKGQKKLENEKYQELRKHLKMNKFKSKRQLKEHMEI